MAEGEAVAVGEGLAVSVEVGVAEGLGVGVGVTVAVAVGGLAAKKGPPDPQAERTITSTAPPIQRDRDAACPRRFIPPVDRMCSSG